MLKENFCNKLSIKNTVCDTVLVVDDDQTLNLNFIFNKDTLKELNIETSE